MNIKTGDKVRFLNEKGVGVVTKIINTRFVTVLADDFEYQYSIDELIVVAEGEDDNSLEFITDKEDRKVSKLSKKHQRKKSLPYRSVDLHIQNLVDNYSGMSNAQILKIQTDHFVKCLNEAVERNEKKIVFIHGVGEGVLRNEIRQLLKSYEGLSYHDASFKLYGSGATEVIIH